jgi:hypothetical protein
MSSGCIGAYGLSANTTAPITPTRRYPITATTDDRNNLACPIQTNLIIPNNTTSDGKNKKVSPKPGKTRCRTGAAAINKYAVTPLATKTKRRARALTHRVVSSGWDTCDATEGPPRRYGSEPPMEPLSGPDI